MNMPATSSAGYSVVPAIVTKNDDKQGRIKVRYPWMDSKQQSDWIQVASPFAGKGFGVFFMPEEKDQVLVACSLDHADRCYVIGALWSRADKPPADDKNKRVIKSASGHVVTFDDTKDGELISIVDKSGKNKIVLDAKNNTVTIESGGALAIKAAGNIRLESDKDVLIKGVNVSIEADSKLAAKANELTLQGPGGVNINDGALEVM